MASVVRVRFASSPTGYLHIGNVRMVIINWLFARQQGGEFVLRIEDSGPEGSASEFEQALMQDLAWLGLNWDEGPGLAGDLGPYRQSERAAIYESQLAELRRRDKAYPCIKSAAELESIRMAAVERGQSAPYKRSDLEATEAECNACERAGYRPAWFFHYTESRTEWHDLVQGRLSFDSNSIGDFVLMRSDGSPTCDFAAAVDDALMKISHVIRGDDHVSNTPKQIAICEALGYAVPGYAHLAMILNPDRTPLSSRQGAISIREFRNKGYLPQALLSYLSLLSWSSASGEEILSRKQLIEQFRFDRMSNSAAIFDMTKLDWVNAHYIRQLSIEEFVQAARPFLEKSQIDVGDEGKLRQVLELVQNSVVRLEQLPMLVEPFYQEVMQPKDGEAIAIASRDSSQKIYWAFLRYLYEYDTLDSSVFRTVMQKVQKESGIMGKDLWMPIRVALTGRIHGPELARVAEILGKDRVITFIKSLVD